ncbi:MAG TPA: 4Fe-4S dicluster domain-containing protein, partial [Longimicrobiaceae bacterium]|nr:4Fe-4S dicluster domain-containing protein [Longimicrobiaceae bacterium]
AGRGVVVAGDRQPPEVHALIHLANSSLGNVGRTVTYVEPTLLEAGEPSHDLAGLVEEMNAGRVDTLLILESNPVYTAPADLDFAGALRRVPHSVRLGLYRDETARACEWTAPAVHYLEAWGDARAYDGTVSFVQPLVAPLYGGKTPAELLSMVLGQPASAHDLLTAYWQGRLGGGSQRAWEEALQHGVVPGTTSAPVAATAAPGALAPALAAVARSREARTRGVEIVFERDAKLYDGRFANNPWLQELPEPITKVTWENTAVISPATARRLGVETGRMLRLEHAGRSVSAPAYVLPGHADDSATVQLGYGRGEGDEAVATGRGFDAYRLRTREAPHVATGARVSALPESRALATTQGEFELHGRPVVLSATLAAYRADPEFTHEHRGRTLSLYSPYQDEYRTGNQWAMAIDLTRCTGCSACVIACVAENNIPVVGRSEVLKNREMHWLRIDRYFTGDPAAPAVAMQPMLCQHCEHAPCEYVCPVNATVHSDEGLNQMVYNRCVGTRFCSNNCPYKVRRFNWLNYTGDLPASEQLAMNPDVTVRARGVMEKCSFCVQRIRETEIHAQLEGRAVRPGEVVTACQQTCPTRAIVFGSYTDPDPELAARLADPRRYAVLHDLGTQPRVRYLAKISNPNPALPHQDSGSRIQDSGGPGTEDRRPTADDRGGEGREGGLRG